MCFISHASVLYGLIKVKSLYVFMYMYVYMWVSSVHTVLWEDLKARDHLADLVKAGGGGLIM